MTETMIDRMLREQSDFTAVERFAAVGHAGDYAARYRDLIPLSKPRAGEQYAFEVDLDRCTGCKACVAGCHSLNGLDDGETWREVGLLAGDRRQQTVTSACHHCVDPGCLEGCPVLAYEKDPETGIVRHLDDQCIGCQYCILKCPYEVPKFSKEMGIVRKCDMCQSRLAVGEAPACVQACPTSAITIRIVRVEEVRQRAEEGEFLPDSPRPEITVPTTRYVSARPMSEAAKAADHFAPRVQHAHWPLVWMLVLTQAGVGCLTAAGLGSPAMLETGVLLVVAGLAASVLHLGQPLKAWRVFLGWRTSWLSREVMVLGGLGKLAMAAWAAGWIPLTQPFQVPLLWSAVAIGWAGVVCSAWVYHDTGRDVWRGIRSFGRFLWTAGLFALLAAGMPAGFFVALGAKISWEASMIFMRLDAAEMTDVDRAAALLRGPLKDWFYARCGFAATAGVAAVCGWIYPAMGLLIAAEICERALFFKSGVAKKMPGQL